MILQNEEVVSLEFSSGRGHFIEQNICVRYERLVAGPVFHFLI